MNKKYKSKKKKKTNGLFIELTNDDKIICSICGSDKTYITIRKNNKGYPVWYNHEGGKICGKCRNRLVTNIKYKSRKSKKFRMAFDGLDVFLSFKLPRDKCEMCGITKDKAKKIDRHHYFYCRIMPWAMTISICSSCHQNITLKGRIIVKSIIRTCLICGITDNYKKISNKYKDGFICKNCYNKIKYSEKKLS